MKLHKKLAHWVVDYGYMIHGAAVSLIHTSPPKHYLGHRIAGKVPVVIIPGIFEKWGTMKKIADAVSLLGHPVYIIPSLGHNLFDIPKSSALVRDIIEKENLKNSILIAHSKGGLIGKYFLIHHNSDSRALGMISIATPYSGSGIVKLMPVRPIRELHSESNIIRELKSHTKVNAKIVSIFPVFDNHVWSEEGSYLEGAKNIEVSVHGHHKIMYDIDVINTIKDQVEDITKQAVVS